MSLSETTAVAVAAGQCAAAVLMVRPAGFAANAQTRASNPFQHASLAIDAAATACAEFDALANRLREAGVRVHAYDDDPQRACPDAVFPNNWFSLHADGSVVLYPMLAPNRRRERRFDLLSRLAREGNYRITRLLDLTHHEAASHYLEGTGSLVLDHGQRVAYACRSPRTHRAPLEEFCAELGFEPCVFDAHDALGVPVYHTNVVLSIGTRFALLAADNLSPADRERVGARLVASGRELLTLAPGQLARFAANALELRNGHGEGVLAMSECAARSFEPAVLRRLRELVGRVLSVPIPTIESVGGGSVRCMLAEVFLPQAGR